MKKVLVFITLLMIVATIGCSGKKESSEDVTLVVWAVDGGNSEDPQQAYAIALAEKFQEEYPKIKLDWVAHGSAGSTLNDKIKVAMANDQGPDIMQSWGGSFMGAFADAGKLMDLTSELNDVETSGAAKSAMSWNGTTYGVAPFFAVAGLFINEGKAKELGIELPINTIEELEAAADKFMAAGIQPFACGAKDKWPLLHTYMYLVNRYGGNIFQDAVKRNKKFDDEAFVKAGEKIQEWTKKGYYGKKPLAEAYADAQLLMNTGKAGMQLSGSWLCAMYSDSTQTDQKISFYAVPEVSNGKGKMTDLMGMTDIGFVASAKSEAKKDAIVKFMKFAMRPEICSEDPGRVASVPGVNAPNQITAKASEIFTKGESVQFWWDQDLPPTVSGPVNDTIQNFMIPGNNVKKLLTKFEKLASDNL